MKRKILQFMENRVRRGYRGGLLIDRLHNNPAAADGQRPEEWLASSVEARNPGLETIAGEGLSRVMPEGVFLKDLFSSEPEFYLGGKHVEKYGLNTGFLAKYLDSSMRLHIQAHPTADYAKKNLNSEWGKLEVYAVLECRSSDSYIYLGFQKAPSYDEWKRIVYEQDKRAMLECFQRIPVKPGDVWYVPGGIPHAIGEGVLMLEVMEPTDWAVRCEFEREGIIVPEAARFMGIDPGKALEIFDFTSYSVEESSGRFKVASEPVESGADFRLERLIGERQTSCFEVLRLSLESGCFRLNTANLKVCSVASGRGTVRAGAEYVALEKGAYFMTAALSGELIFEASGREGLEILICRPQL